MATAHWARGRLGEPPWIATQLVRKSGIPLQVASCAHRSTASPGRLGYAIVDMLSPTWLLDRSLVIGLARRLLQVWPESGDYRSRHYHVRYWSNSHNKLL